MPKPLNAERIKQFESRPATRTVDPSAADRAGEVNARWPSREPIRDGQMSIKAPLDAINRFKRICKDDRRTYADMLSILMDLYELKE